MTAFFPPKPDLSRVEAESVEDGPHADFFYARCSDGHLFAVSLYTNDGSMVECDYYRCMKQHWFYAGKFASHRKSE